MNSLVSYNWLAEYVDLKGITPDEFAKRMSLSGPAVEKIYPGVAAYGDVLLDDKIIVGYVREVRPHPNADKLRIAGVDVGAQHAVPLQIVCGGSNLKADQWVAVGLIGARVRWHGAGELVELQPTEIRGVKSEGMICAASEIGLADAFPHAEREILDLDVALGWGGAYGDVSVSGSRKGVSPRAPTKPGVPLADLLGLSADSVMDIEVTSNRVDAMGMVGMAREAAAILKRKFVYKKFEIRNSKFETTRRSNLSIKIAAKKHCPRYMAVRIDGVTVGQSPWWLKRRLMSAGLRPINTLVDISNYVMLELAQPTHMFDAGKLEGGITVRMAHAGESIKALDGKSYELDDSILLIADDRKPIAIAGVMGGEETGVSESTTSIIIECATFDPVTIRRGARTLNLQSDAQLRFEKGLSTQALPEAMARTIELVCELAGGSVASKVTDVGTATYQPLRYSISTDEVSALIGVSVPTPEMKDVLLRLGFVVSLSGKKLTAKVPWWRDHDIEDGRDLVEEIARVRGYANIPAVTPVGLAPRPMDPELVWEKQVRDISKSSGLTEVYTYSFVSKELLEKAGYDPTHMLHVQNPLSVDFEIMRTTLLPSLLHVAAENRERFPEQRIFEVANVYYPAQKVLSPKSSVQSPQSKVLDSGLSHWSDLPDEQLELGALFMGMDRAWKHAKGYVEHLLTEMGIQAVSWRRLEDDPFWHPGRSLQAFHGEELIATLGEVSPKITSRFKCDLPVAMVDIPLEKIVTVATMGRTYAPISLFPEAKRDLAVVVDTRVEYADVAGEIHAAVRELPLHIIVEWFDTYRGDNLPEHKKSLAMHLTFSAADRTLENREVDALMEKISAILKEKFTAELRG